ncbi:MAG: hypothetical protein SF123_10795 [Chloroflexota bacterium]|nr:hypothetical protein [Chloroflexota bacterium]
MTTTVQLICAPELWESHGQPIQLALQNQGYPVIVPEVKQGSWYFTSQLVVIVPGTNSVGHIEERILSVKAYEQHIFVIVVAKKNYIKNLLRKSHNIRLVRWNPSSRLDTSTRTVIDALQNLTNDVIGIPQNSTHIGPRKWRIGPLNISSNNVFIAILIGIIILVVQQNWNYSLCLISIKDESCLSVVPNISGRNISPDSSLELEVSHFYPVNGTHIQVKLNNDEVIYEYRGDRVRDRIFAFNINLLDERYPLIRGENSIGFWLNRDNGTYEEVRTIIFYVYGHRPNPSSPLPIPGTFSPPPSLSSTIDVNWCVEAARLAPPIDVLDNSDELTIVPGVILPRTLLAVFDTTNPESIGRIDGTEVPIAQSRIRNCGNYRSN